MSSARVRSEQACFGGVQGFYEHDSSACGGPMRFGVYVPPQAKEAPTPVLYYLAGLTCNEETFVIKAGAQRVAAELGLTLVTADTSPRASRYPGDDASWDFGVAAGFYVDSTEAPWSATYRMFEYVTRELPALVSANFKVDASRAGVFGHSMGGHGALVCGLRAPEVFRSVSAFAPISSPTRCPWGERALSGYLGSDRSAWHDYDATSLVHSGKRTTLLLVDQGTSDKFLDLQLKPELLERACKDSGQPLTLRRHEGYDHSYYFIATFVDDHLRHHAATLNS